MISLSVNIEGDARISLLEPKDLQRLTRHAGTKVQQAVKKNFESLPGERFYKDAAEATRLEMQGDAALITVATKACACAGRVAAICRAVW